MPPATGTVLSARFMRAIDGDTYVLHAARFGSFDRRATVDAYRLQGFRARELSDTASDETRVDGKTARTLAGNALATANMITVEEHGLDEYGRILSVIWVDAMLLSSVLTDAHAVIPGKTKGLSA